MNRNLNSTMSVLAGAALGAGLMYFLDPDRGGRRRALVRDRAASVLHDTTDALGKAGRDLRNRARGAVAEAGSHLKRDASPDERLVARVRSRMGRYVSHPHAIEVAAEEGRVRLSGPILQNEVESFLSAIQSVRGIKALENQLEPHETADIPALQGGSAPAGEPGEFEQYNWAPSMRLLAGGVGMALLSYGLRRRGPLGIPGALIGAGLLARGIGNVPLTELVHHQEPLPEGDQEGESFGERRPMQ
jgi:hypothetical protein